MITYYVGVLDTTNEKGGYLIKSDEFGRLKDAIEEMKGNPEFACQKCKIIAYDDVVDYYYTAYEEKSEQEEMDDYYDYCDNATKLGKDILDAWTTGKKEVRDVVVDFIKNLKNNGDLERLLRFF